MLYIAIELLLLLLLLLLLVLLLLLLLLYYVHICIYTYIHTFYLFVAHASQGKPLNPSAFAPLNKCYDVTNQYPHSW